MAAFISTLDSVPEVYDFANTEPVCSEQEIPEIFFEIQNRKKREEQSADLTSIVEGKFCKKSRNSNYIKSFLNSRFYRKNILKFLKAIFDIRMLFTSKLRKEKLYDSGSILIMKLFIAPAIERKIIVRKWTP